jgi:hypothetical protein
MKANQRELWVFPNGKLFLLLLLFAYEVENVRIVEIFLNAMVRSSTLGKNNLLSIAFQTSFYNWV